MYSRPSGPIAVTCVTYSPDFAQWKWGVLPGKNDHGAGRIGFQLIRVEFVTQSDVKDARNHGADSVLRVLDSYIAETDFFFPPSASRRSFRSASSENGF